MKLIRSPSSQPSADLVRHGQMVMVGPTTLKLINDEKHLGLVKQMVIMCSAL